MEASSDSPKMMSKTRDDDDVEYFTLSGNIVKSWAISHCNKSVFNCLKDEEKNSLTRNETDEKIFEETVEESDRKNPSLIEDISQQNRSIAENHDHTIKNGCDFESNLNDASVQGKNDNTNSFREINESLDNAVDYELLLNKMILKDKNHINDDDKGSKSKNDNIDEHNLQKEEEEDDQSFIGDNENKNSNEELNEHNLQIKEEEDDQSFVDDNENKNSNEELNEHNLQIKEEEDDQSFIDDNENKNSNEELNEQNLQIKDETDDESFADFDDNENVEISEEEFSSIIEKCSKCNKYVYDDQLYNHKKICPYSDLPIDKEKFCCYYCNDYYNTEKDIIEHFLYSHEKLKPYKCKICDKNFKSINLQDSHVQNEHNKLNDDEKLLFRCLLCQNKYLSFQRLYKHEKVVHILVDKECKICFKKFKNVHCHRLHMRGHEILRPFNCIDCRKSFSAQRLLQIHRNNKHNIDFKYKCGLCDKSFQNTSGLKRHELCAHYDEYKKRLNGNEVKKVNNEMELQETKDKQNSENDYLSTLDISKCEKCHLLFYPNINAQHKTLCSGLRYEKSLKDYGCVYCNEMYDTLEMIVEHLEKSHPKEAPYKCMKCDNVCFKTMSSLDRHTREFHIDSIKFLYKCNLCSMKTFSSVGQLYQHKKRYHMIENHKCPICSKEFQNLHKYNYHVKSHDSKKPFACRYCTKSFLQKHHLTNHETVHTGERRYKCNLCDKTFKLQTAFTIHMRVHNGIKPYLCNICAKAFTTRASLQCHITTHEPKSEVHQCNVCNKKLSSRSTLYKHLRLHDTNIDKSNNNEKKILRAYDFQKHVCSICSAKFSLPASLEKHVLNMHDKNRKYKCSICERAYKKSDHLRIHIRKEHTNERPYSCQYCDKKFADKSQKNYHEKSHSDNPTAYICNFCHQPFKTSYALRFHRLSHTGLKPHQCSICCTSFKNYISLRIHYDKHTDQEKEYEKQRVLDETRDFVNNDNAENDNEDNDNEDNDNNDDEEVVFKTESEIVVENEVILDMNS